MNDLKFALRQLVKNPGFTAVAVLTLALGIGANTAIFSVVNFVLLRPLTYAASGQLVRVYESRPSAGLQRGPISPANFRDWQSQATLFENLAAFNDVYVNLTGAGEPERLEGTRVSANIFSVLRVHPLLGRAFTPDEERDGRVVILSYHLWQKRFGGQSDILGKPITLDKQSYSVVGVMPPGFKFPDQPDLWAPLRFTESEETERGTRFLSAVGRLKPGVSVAQAEAEMHAIGLRLAQQFGDNRGWTSELITMRDELVGDVKPALILLSLGVGFVLLIACGNLANLSLAKSAARQREIAVRVALGARRGRILRQLMTESLLLSLFGGAMGILLAVWGTRTLGSLVPPGLPRLQGSGLDGRVLGLTLLISILTAALFGLVPALQSSRVNLDGMLKEGARRAARIEPMEVMRCE